MRERRIPTVQLLVVALISLSSALVVIAASRMARGGNGPRGPADLWLPLSSEAREAYVWGYLHGFDRGKHEGCVFYGEKMEIYMHEPVPLEKSPRVVCLDALPGYPESNVKVYADAITRYYVKYPQDPGVGPPTIMSQLASPPGLTIDQIHAKFSGAPGH
jgi:hypothetical protein